MSLLGLDEASSPTIEQRVNTLPPRQTLATCPDCGKLISLQAVSCPGCGRGFHTSISSISRSGWVGTIAGGVILGYIGITIINVVLFFVMIFFFAGLIGSTLPNSNPQRPARSYTDR